MSVSSLHLPIAIATRPQFGSAPWTAVLTSGELTMALATRLACASSRAPSTVHLDQLLGALAVAGDLLGQRERDLEQRRVERAEVDRAGGAAGQDDRGVAGGRVGVDRDAVERAVDDAGGRSCRASAGRRRRR